MKKIAVVIAYIAGIFAIYWISRLASRYATRALLDAGLSPVAAVAIVGVVFVIVLVVCWRVALRLQQRGGGQA